MVSNQVAMQKENELVFTKHQASKDTSSVNMNEHIMVSLPRQDSRQNTNRLFKFLCTYNHVCVQE